MRTPSKFHKVVKFKHLLTNIELQRYEKCVKDFGSGGYLYFVTLNGFSVWYSKYSMKSKETVFDKSTMRDITDVDVRKIKK